MDASEPQIVLSAKLQPIVWYDADHIRDGGKWQTAADAGGNPWETGCARVLRASVPRYLQCRPALHNASMFLVRFKPEGQGQGAAAMLAASRARPAITEPAPWCHSTWNYRPPGNAMLKEIGLDLPLGHDAKAIPAARGRATAVTRTQLGC